MPGTRTTTKPKYYGRLKMAYALKRRGEQFFVLGKKYQRSAMNYEAAHNAFKMAFELARQATEITDGKST